MQFFTTNLNMCLVLKSEWEKWNFHRNFDKNSFLFLQEKQYCIFLYFKRIFAKTNLKKSFLPKWSAKNSLQTLRVSTNLDVIAGSTGDFWWNDPGESTRASNDRRLDGMAKTSKRFAHRSLQFTANTRHFARDRNRKFNRGRNENDDEVFHSVLFVPRDHWTDLVGGERCFHHRDASLGWCSPSSTIGIWSQWTPSGSDVDSFQRSCWWHRLIIDDLSSFSLRIDQAELENVSMPYYVSLHGAHWHHWADRSSSIVVNPIMSFLGDSESQLLGRTELWSDVRRVRRSSSISTPVPFYLRVFVVHVCRGFFSNRLNMSSSVCRFSPHQTNLQASSCVSCSWRTDRAVQKRNSGIINSCTVSGIQLISSGSSIVRCASMSPGLVTPWRSSD